MNNISLEYPYLLLLIIPFIIIEFIYKNKTSSYYIPHIKIFNQNKISNNIIIKLLKWVMIISLIISISSPYKKLQTQKIKKDGIDIVLTLDTSGSMKQTRFNPNNIRQNRWEVVSQIVQEFIPKRINDNIALIVFGTSVMTASPLSFDKSAQAKIIKYLKIGMAGEKTALIDSLAGSINILKKSKSKSKVIILLTDGEDTASIIPLNVVEKLIKKYDIKLYAIGIGQANKYMLNKLASINKGKAYYANSKYNLEQIYKQINDLEKSKIEQNKIINKEYLYIYTLFISIIMLFLYLFLRIKHQI
jgi:Ca-activated chloride channel homolog